MEVFCEGGKGRSVTCDNTNWNPVTSILLTRNKERLNFDFLIVVNQRSDFFALILKWNSPILYFKTDFSETEWNHWNILSKLKCRNRFQIFLEYFFFTKRVALGLIRPVYNCACISNEMDGKTGSGTFENSLPIPGNIKSVS